jgi:hypothetical protein
VGTNVRVAALCPTFVKTNIVHNGRVPEETSKLASQLMARTGVSPASVVKTTLNAFDATAVRAAAARGAPVLAHEAPGPCGLQQELGLARAHVRSP